MQRPRRTVDDDDCGDVGFLSIDTAGSPPTSSAAVGFTRNDIFHTVSRFDTLAGVAIRYGVEVADIKRLNGLSTDLQMFALKTLRIPLPGKHPPSPNLSNGHHTPYQYMQKDDEQKSSKHYENDLFDSFQSLKLSPSSERKVSPAMSSLQGYYGTRQGDKKTAVVGEFEMAVYKDGAGHQLQNGATASSSPPSNPALSHNRKSRSVASSLMSANGSLHDPLLSREGESSTGSDKWMEKLLRRRQKSESDFSSYPQEKLLREDMSGGSTISPVVTGRGLAPRPKSCSRSVSEADSSEPPAIASSSPTPSGDTHLNDTSDSVRKSASSSSLLEADNSGGTFASLWPTPKWILKPDFLAFSSAAIPILDGLPKAIGMKSKTALD